MIYKNEEIEKSLMQTYADLIVVRDEERKKAEIFYESFVRKFGELIEEEFRASLEVIKLKAAISFCQKRVNSDMKIVRSELNDYVALISDAYDFELDEIRRIKEEKTQTISNYEVRLIRKSYKRIAMMVHPDLFPEAFANEKIAELWEKAKEAYASNRFEDIKEAEIAIRRLLDKQLDLEDLSPADADEKIEKIAEEIHTIKTTKPYTYGELLSDDEAVEKEREKLKGKIAEHKKYAEMLEAEIEKFEISEDAN
ncbi:MAG: hypothetical protein PUJ49_02840 [bacterium]|nr:hypothetical protein [bacterium]